MKDYGDRAVRFPLPPGGHRRLFDALRRIAGVRDVILVESIGCVIFDGENPAAHSAIGALLARPSGGSGISIEMTTSHEIPVVYDGEDLASVAEAIGRSPADVIAMHGDGEYKVAMLGFLPGFAYLRGVPEPLALPRRAPRARVPAGSVAIAAGYAGVYPLASPGGWHLLGRTGFETFDPHAGATLAIGDRVRFVSVAELEHEPPATRPPLRPISTAHLEITRTAGFAVLVDGGRPGQMHQGIPSGGPMVAALHDRANALAGNSKGACAVEVTGTFEVVARGGTVTIADPNGRVDLAEGDRHVVSTTGAGQRVTYLAVAGGIEAPVVLGSRSILLVAGIGEPLKKGALLGAGSAAPSTGAPHAVELPAEIALLPGPETVPGFSLEQLTRTEITISPTSDRMGTRLNASLTIPELTINASNPMVHGAIELTPSGLIVMGPDHPTTGGYPVVGVLAHRSHDAFFAKPIGARVRFVLG